MKKIVAFVLALAALPAWAQIKAGPMLGYSEMKEVLLWVQTEKAQPVKFVYWDKENPATKLTTEEVISSSTTDYTVKLIANQVQPGKKYQYEVHLGGKKVNVSYPLEFQTQTLWQYRTDPPAFKFAVGSCVYTNEPAVDRPGQGYGKGMGIFSKIYDQKPQFMVWGGDNVYFREVDWNTKTGMYHRYAEFKKQPELQPLFGSVHHYAIWDDHDYGPNDTDRSFWGKRWVLEVFKNHWGNPNYIFENEAVTGTFFWEDCQFFLMDDRWFRAPNGFKDHNKEYWGEKQLQWLIDALKTSSAPFKFVVNGGQVVNPVGEFENYSAHAGERAKFLAELQRHNIPGVIFISGDRHHTNLQKLERPGTYPLYDLTVSPLTSGAGKPTDKELAGAPIVPGTQVNEMQNFGILEVSGKRTERMLKIQVFDKEGQPKWDYTIQAKDLR